MKTPVIILNFKAYREASGKRGLALANICEEVAEDTGASIVIAPQQIDLSLIVREVGIPVLAQHVDYNNRECISPYIPTHPNGGLAGNIRIFGQDNSSNTISSDDRSCTR